LYVYLISDFNSIWKFLKKAWQINEHMIYYMSLQESESFLRSW
jgi:hypothetical protein